MTKTNMPEMYGCTHAGSIEDLNF